MFLKQIDLTLKMAKSANFYAEEVLKQKGSLTVRDTTMYAGSTQLNDDVNIVDHVKNNLGFGCTIFFGKQKDCNNSYSEKR